MKNAVPVVAAVGAGWLTWLWLWPLGLAIAVPLVALAAQKGKKPGLAAAGLSPFVMVPVFGFMAGMADYMQGTASLTYPGLITAESNNLHASYRVPMRHTGRVDEGSEAFYRVARNAAVHMMGNLFGPTAKAFKGQYPSREAAWRLLESAPGASISEGKLMLHVTNYPKVAVGPLLPILARHPERRIRAVLTGETLVVGVPNELWLVDTTKGQPFVHWLRKDLRMYWPGEEPVAEVVETHTP